MERPEYERMYQLEDTHWWFVGRRQLALALIEKWVKGYPQLRLLDIGCGTGGNLAYLARPGSGVGIDLSPYALNFARRRHLASLAQASSLALPYPDSTFAVVTLFDVLYHRWVANDDQALREAYRVLQPGGWLLITDSALPSLWSIHDEIYYARQRYTVAVMLPKLEQIGFEVGFYSYTNALLLPVVVVTRLLARFLGTTSDDLQPLPSWLNGLLLGVRNLETAWLSRGRRFPLGSSLVCLTRKPQLGVNPGSLEGRKNGRSVNTQPSILPTFHFSIEKIRLFIP
jgi:ubiquinone/menaquinone biosynthesis C-methylase UbiE